MIKILQHISSTNVWANSKNKKCLPVQCTIYTSHDHLSYILHLLQLVHPCKASEGTDVEVDPFSSDLN